MAIDISSLLWSRPGMNGGRLCAAGTGVSMMQIAVCRQRGESPEEIVENYPQLTLATVHAALAYYYANRQEVDDALAAEEAEYDRLAAAARSKQAAKT
jgi:uncharacterized protein (DUF433 family)